MAGDGGPKCNSSPGGRLKQMWGTQLWGLCSLTSRHSLQGLAIYGARVWHNPEGTLGLMLGAALAQGCQPEAVLCHL